jgi:hypothetical protein
LTVIRSGVEPARALEVERLDRHRDHAELFLQRVRDRVVPGAGDVEVRGAAAAVADRKRLVRDEHPERGERDGRRRRRTRVAVDAAGAGDGWSSRAPASNGVEAVTTRPPAARRARMTYGRLRPGRPPADRIPPIRSGRARSWRIVVTAGLTGQC